MPPTRLKSLDSGHIRRVVALILAAGQSRRMGRPKQLLPYKDGTILDAVIEAALESSIDGIVVVANPLVAANLEGRLPAEDCALVVNVEPDSEMLRSAQLGLQRLVDRFEAAASDGILILLGDQPQVTGGLITTCAEAFRLPKNPPGILIATYKGRRGHPAIFRVGVMREIETWASDRRLNELAELHPEQVRELPITTAPMPIDVNTQHEYLKLKEED
jgi:molybdenum cofactor cytidylyltransferase